MKKLFILMLFLVSVSNLFSQFEIKGVKLGAKNINNELISLIGKDYWLVTSNLKDSTCAAIFAVPCTIDGKVRRIYSEELTTLVNAVQDKFSIKLRPSVETGGDISYLYRKDNIYVSISAEHNRYMDIPYKVKLVIMNIDLLSKLKDEEQKESDKNKTDI